MQNTITLFLIIATIILLILVAIRRNKRDTKCVKTKSECNVKRFTRMNKKMKSHKKQ